MRVTFCWDQQDVAGAHFMVAVGGVRFLQQQELRNERNITTDIYIGIASDFGVHCLTFATAKERQRCKQQRYHAFAARAVN